MDCYMTSKLFELNLKVLCLSYNANELHTNVCVKIILKSICIYNTKFIELTYHWCNTKNISRYILIIIFTFITQYLEYNMNVYDATCMLNIKTNTSG